MSCLTLRIYSAILCTRILLNLNGYFYKFSTSMKSTIPHLYFMMMKNILHLLPPPGISTTRSLCRSRTRCWRSTRSGRSGSSPRRTWRTWRGVGLSLSWPARRRCPRRVLALRALHRTSPRRHVCRFSYSLEEVAKRWERKHQNLRAICYKSEIWRI